MYRGILLAKKSAVGPHTVTLIENIVNFLHVPYEFGSLILTFILGPPGAIFTQFICTRDVSEAISRTVFLFFGSSIPFLQGFLSLTLLALFFFYLLFMIQYMRQKLLNSEDELIPLILGGKEAFDEIYGVVSKSGPPLIFSFVILVLFFIQNFSEVPDNFIVFCTDNLSYAFIGLSLPFWFFAFCTFVWVYIGSIRGLYSLGKNVILKNYHEDKMLGVKPIGSLSLSLTYTYFAGLIILLLIPMMLQPDASIISYLVILSFCILIGIFMFFLPQYTIHKKMVEAKQREQRKLRRELFNAVSKMDDSERDIQSDEDIKTVLRKMTAVMHVDLTRDEIDAIPTWPIDTEIINSLSRAAISVFLVILAQYIMRKVIGLIPS